MCACIFDQLLKKHETYIIYSNSFILPAFPADKNKIKDAMIKKEELKHKKLTKKDRCVFYALFSFFSRHRFSAHTCPSCFVLLLKPNSKISVQTTFKNKSDKSHKINQ